MRKPQNAGARKPRPWSDGYSASSFRGRLGSGGAHTALQLAQSRARLFKREILARDGRRVARCAQDGVRAVECRIVCVDPQGEQVPREVLGPESITDGPGLEALHILEGEGIAELFKDSPIAVVHGRNRSEAVENGGRLRSKQLEDRRATAREGLFARL